MKIKYTVITMLFISIFVMSCQDDSSMQNTNNPLSPNASFDGNTVPLTQTGNNKALPNNKHSKVFRAANVITVDGNENDWDDVPKRKMRQYYDLDGPVDNKFDLSAYFKMLWDDDNLYVFVRILDDELSVNAENDYDKDSFELFLDADNSKNPPPDDQIPHPYPGSYDSNDDQLRFVWQEDPYSTRGNSDISSFEYAYLDTDKGWTLEIKMPFTALTDFPAQAGHVFGVEFHVNDNDGEGRQNFLKWSSESDYTYLYPSLFGSAYLFDSTAN